MTPRERGPGANVTAPRAVRWAMLASLALLGCGSCGGGTAVMTARATGERPSAGLRHLVGTNLDFPTDWSTELPFVDLMRTSRGWISGSRSAFEDGRSIALGPDGWPARLEDGQLARALIAMDHDRLPAGTYTLTWRGRGRVEVQPGRIGEVRAAQRVVEESPNRLRFRLDPAADGPSLPLAITETDPSDPLRDLRVLLPGGACAEDAARSCDSDHECRDAGARCVPFEESSAERPFNPRFLASMRTYSLIRFMNWADANSTIVSTFETDWESRVEPSEVRWPRVPLELMADLANEADADVWLSLPSQATDDYARRAGALFRERLEAGRRVWVEYSNEVWNDQFPQARFARTSGLRMFPGTPEPEAAAHFYARRSRELHRLFAEGMGDDPEHPRRIVRVIATQAVNPWLSNLILSFDDTAAHADVLAVAPYFGTFVTSDQHDAWRGLDLDGFFARLEATEPTDALRAVREQAEVARAHGLELVTYEGGQHFVAPDEPTIAAMFLAANRDPRMGAFYDTYLDAWHAESPGVFVHLASCAAPNRWGSWGALEYAHQPFDRAPKFEALRRFAARTASR